MKIKKILIIGGAGYIGSHMTQLLIDKGYKPAVFDRVALRSKPLALKVKYIKGDLRNYGDIRKAMVAVKPDLVMHFAALLNIPESVAEPLKYYENNVLGPYNLLKAMNEFGVKNIIFSSTAAVYGNPKSVPIKEDASMDPINTYGRTKLMFEQMLRSMVVADKRFSYIAFRYFNAAGAHASGHLGECHEPETHLIPNVLRTIKGELKELMLYGDDYPTKDGTCVRDYIHVEDLAEAHFLGIKALDKGIRNEVFNLGTGTGHSIMDIIKTAEKVTGQEVRYKICPRRSGDPAKLVASSNKAKKILGWKTKRDINAIITTAWEWEKGH